MGEVTRPHAVEFRARYGETDQMGVVYHAVYLAWCEIGRTEFIRSRGMSYADMERKGTLLAVAEASVRYVAPARYDDMVRVETSLVEVGSRALTFEYVILHAASRARFATARTLLVAIDPEGRTTIIPAEIRTLLASALLDNS